VTSTTEAANCHSEPVVWRRISPVATKLRFFGGKAASE
jgi:hypothetical protein